MRNLGKSVVVAVLAACGPVASAAVISSWNFEGLTVSSTAGTSPSPTAGTLTSDTGNGELTGVHALATSVWSTPAGNGSTKSISANGWSHGDYWQFTSNTTGNTGIMVLVDATRSSTGPAGFKVQYSSTGAGGTFTDLPGGDYTVAQVTFSSGTENTNSPPRFLFDLSGVTALDNNPNAAFRLVQTSATGAATGTQRIDNVVVGTGLVIPEPTAAAFGLLAGGMLIRRRK